MPRGLDNDNAQFVFCNSGAEAVENAIKVARAATGRPNIVCFEGRKASCQGKHSTRTADAER
eukprot:scaffold121502_cov35-Prasinocladus_malaysianus.AAC.2